MTVHGTGADEDALHRQAELYAREAEAHIPDFPELQARPGVDFDSAFGGG